MQYDNSLETKQPWLLQVFLDEDEDEVTVWNKNFDPDIDLLFGKHGLPSEIWQGKNIFKDPNTAP